MFTQLDADAAMMGMLCALYSIFFGRGVGLFVRLLLGYASGTAASYLGFMAYGVWFDAKLLETLIHANPVMLCLDRSARRP